MNTKFNLSLFTLSIMAFIFLVGCSSSNTTSSNPTPAISSIGINKVITGDEAKKMMDQDKNILILDVRTQAEYDQGHIQNAILIPHTDILAKAPQLLHNKSKTILIYCRSGRRSALAANDLASLGYTNLYDFGGINDWNYDVVTSK